MPTTLVLHYDTSTGRTFAQRLAGTEIVDGAITSSKIASGQVGDAHIFPASIISAKIAANVIATPHIANQGLLSASFGANVIAAPHIKNQGLLSANYAGLSIGGAHVANQGLVSANLAVGVIGDTLVANFGLVSGKYASGSITDQALASGFSVDVAEIVQEPSYRAQYLVSAFLGVQFSVSGHFNYTQAGDFSSMPAVGLSIANILSGQIGTFQYGGRLQNAGWNFSGYIGKMLFLGTSSEVTLTAPSASGQCVQRMGKVIGTDNIFLKPDLTFIQLAQ